MKNQTVDSLIEGFFNKKKNKIDLDKLIKSGLILKEIESQRTERVIQFPVFRHSNKIGVVGSSARQHFERLAKGIKGNTLQDKFNFIQNLMNGVDLQNKGIDEVVSTLIMVDILNAMIENLEATAAGFLFEYFLAGLLEGTTEGFGGNAKIADIALLKKGEELPMLPLSLKLRSRSRPLGGSFSLLLKYFQNNDRLVHIMGEKIHRKNVLTSIAVYEYALHKENFIQEVSNIEQILKMPLGRIEELSFEEIVERWGMLLAKEKEYKADKSLKVHEVLAKQFSVPTSLWKTKENLIGTLLISRERYNEVFENYVKIIQTQIEEIFFSLKELTDNITYFYTHEEGRIQYGINAKKAASNLKTSVDKEIGDVQKASQGELPLE
tara:strand:+ start:1223 stop:2362 length:1140 start_codon:yes stop_codon:yes gene_type:complete